MKKQLLSRKDIVVEVQDFSHDLAIFCEGKGYFHCDFLAGVKIQGRDASDFLNRLSTLDFKQFSYSERPYGAFLTGKGTLISLGWFEAIDDGFCYWTYVDERDSAYQYLDQMHFGESLKLERWDEEPIAVLNSQTGIKDTAIPFLYWQPQNDRSLIEKSPRLGFRVFEWMRRSASIPRLNADLSPQQLFLETQFLPAISRNKGCYPGQEVIERIFTYGQVNRKMKQVQLTSLTDLAFPMDSSFDLTVEGQKAGEWAGGDGDPRDSKRARGLAYIHKKFDSVSVFSTPFDGVQATII